LFINACFIYTALCLIFRRKDRDIVISARNTALLISDCKCYTVLHNIWSATTFHAGHLFRLQAGLLIILLFRLNAALLD